MSKIKNRKKEEWVDWFKFSGKRVTTPGIGPYADMWLAYGVTEALLKQFPEEELRIIPRTLRYEVSWNSLTEEEVREAIRLEAEEMFQNQKEFPLGWSPTSNQGTKKEEISEFPMQYDPTLSKGLVSIKNFKDTYVRKGKVPSRIAVLAANAVREYSTTIRSGKTAQALFFSPSKPVSSSELLMTKELAMSRYYSKTASSTLARFILFLEVMVPEGFNINLWVLEKGNKGYQSCRQTRSESWESFFDKISLAKYNAAERDAKREEEDEGTYRTFHDLYSFFDDASKEKNAASLLLFLKTDNSAYLYQVLRRMTISKGRLPSARVISCLLSSRHQKK